MADKETTFKNGDRVRRWIVTGIAIFVFVSGLLGTWFGLCGHVTKIEQAHAQAVANEIERDRIITARLAEVRTEGTALSRQNQREIIGLQVKINSIDYTVKKIAEKLNVN